jgi:SagB-type dehydrogenase family enzyme
MSRTKRDVISIITVVLILTAIIYLTWPKPYEPAKFKPYEPRFVYLPKPERRGTVSVEEAIQRRRSIRSYTDEPLTLQDISQLLWAAQGITDPARKFRAAPSAGALYPLEVYLVVGRGGVKGLEEGLYHYDPYEHGLRYILTGDLRPDLAEAALGQIWVREAPIVIVITAVYERTTAKYGERGLRYVHMEAGHIGQNLYLQAVARGLGMVVVGAFYDETVQEVLQLPKDHKPLYLIPVGHPE